MSEKKKKEKKKIPKRIQTKQWVDPQNTEDAAGKSVDTKKKKNIKTPDNFGYGDMTPEFRRKWQEEILGR